MKELLQPITLSINATLCAIYLSMATNGTIHALSVRKLCAKYCWSENKRYIAYWINGQTDTVLIDREKQKWLLFADHMCVSIEHGIVELENSDFHVLFDMLECLTVVLDSVLEQDWKPYPVTCIDPNEKISRWS